MSLVVASAPNFSITASPSSLSIQQGAAGSATIAVRTGQRLRRLSDVLGKWSAERCQRILQSGEHDDLEHADLNGI